MTCKKIFLGNVVFYLYLSTVSAFAADQAAREEVSPPSEDGPITAEQIQPLNVPDQQNPATPQQPATGSPPPAQTNPTGTQAAPLQ